MAKKQQPSPKPEQEKTSPQETYGWEFHRGPLVAAALLTGLFYLAVWIFFG